MTPAKALLTSVVFTITFVWLSWGPFDSSSGTDRQSVILLHVADTITAEKSGVDVLNLVETAEPEALDPASPAYYAPMEAMSKGSLDNSGLYMDPNDPSTWVEEDIGRLNVGEPMDPNDPSTWGESDTGRLNIGEPMNPNDPSTWGTGAQVRINVGEPMDPNDFSTWRD